MWPWRMEIGPVPPRSSRLPFYPSYQATIAVYSSQTLVAAFDVLYDMTVLLLSNPRTNLPRTVAITSMIAKENYTSSSAGTKK